MISFFHSFDDQIYAVQSKDVFDNGTLEKLCWVFGEAKFIDSHNVTGIFRGPRAAMITPWSTNAVEITQNMGIAGIERIEVFAGITADTFIDPMLFARYNGLDQTIFEINILPDEIVPITNIDAYNKAEGLSLSDEEVQYLEKLAQKLGRNLTDSEVFGFSQVNSEHCRHKIFNGTFVIDGVEKPSSLFKMIKKTSQEHPNGIVSAYKDNVAFVKGPTIQNFAPEQPDQPSAYAVKDLHSIISLKAETHNFPTTVEPFNGAATGSGGEIRDRLAGGTGSIPLVGTAVYMTSYSRLNDARSWENGMEARKWLYQTPMDILLKASNGASDFGNKFGQPLIAGSLFTFEHQEGDQKMGFDKVIMMAGGVGFGKEEMAQKKLAKKGDSIVVMGGDNYRIGMGGAAVSSADTGAFASGIELNAVQRSNPEMQKRVSNAVVALVESDHNPIISIHDHGAGGHLNCLSELVEATGGIIHLEKLPVGDPTLSAKEIIGNESQERMGIVIAKEDFPLLKTIAERERAPIYEVGTITEDHHFIIKDSKTGLTPLDLAVEDMLGSSPKTIMNDEQISRIYAEPSYDKSQIHTYITNVLKLEGVACKDWLTNKVDRCVSGKIAVQQCCGPLQLPLNNCGVVAMDFYGTDGIATSIGHAPVTAVIDAAAGSRMAITESLTNLVWAPLKEGLTSVSLSANWMWPCRNKGEDARLYDAVEAASAFAIELGINIPTGKDSLSMSQKYADGPVLAPGTVIISAVGHCEDFTKVVTPVLKRASGQLFYIDLSQSALTLGGSSFAQTLNTIGNTAADVKSASHLKKVFNVLQDAIRKDLVWAGHDVSSGGLLTTLLEMCFAETNTSAKIDLNGFAEGDLVKILFAENSALVLQGDSTLASFLNDQQIAFINIGEVNAGQNLVVDFSGETMDFNIPSLRDAWFETSYLLDIQQSGPKLAKERYDHYKNQPLVYQFPGHFTGKKIDRPSNKRPKAAIIREKGSNSEREMANAMYQMGFDVKDVHMTDLIYGREDLTGVQFIGAVGGFSNSDVLGSAKGWAGAFKYNEKAKKALHDFFKREDTLSVGICNGCQLFMELDLIYPEHEIGTRMHHNNSHKYESKFTSVTIQENNSVMLSTLAGSTLGIWVAHGEGKFKFPYTEDQYNIVGKFAYSEYPGNPNGSDFDVAMLASMDGRHLVTMPHFERSFFPWNWPYYQGERKDEVSPWAEAFLNARLWLEGK